MEDAYLGPMTAAEAEEMKEFYRQNEIKFKARYEREEKERKHKYVWLDYMIPGAIIIIIFLISFFLIKSF